MEQSVTLSRVQDAMDRLRAQGERVSRRHVRAMTGGSMSTVHRLMSQIQEAEALEARRVDNIISPKLVKAIATEMQEQIQKATTDLLKQIDKMKEREEEVLVELSKVEETNAALKVSLKKAEEKAEDERAELQRLEVTWQARETVQKQVLQDVRGEIQSLQSLLVTVRLEKERLLSQVDHLAQDLIKAQERGSQLVKERNSFRQQVVGLEKNAAVAKQQLQDQKRRLAKMEKRVERALE